MKKEKKGGKLIIIFGIIIEKYGGYIHGNKL